MNCSFDNVNSSLRRLLGVMGVAFCVCGCDFFSSGSELYKRAKQLEYPYGGSSDFEQAKELYLRAVRKGSPEAMAVVGERMYYGIGIEKNKAEGMRLLRQAAKAEVLDGMYALARIILLDNKWGVPKEAEAMLLKCHQYGYNKASFLLGRYYFSNNKCSMACKYFEEAAINGDNGADCLLGMIYFSGMGDVKRDWAKSYVRFTRAAMEQWTSDDGSLKTADAKFYLGMIKISINECWEANVPHLSNFSEGLKLLKESAAEGCEAAIEVLNEMKESRSR